MNKDEIIAYLNSVPGNPRILLAADAEGNSFSSLDEGCESYVPHHYTTGRTEEVFTAEDLVDEADPDEAVLEDFDKVIVLWPI